MNVLPLYPNDAFGFPTGLLLGTLVGFAFGFVLERAGFGNAKNLAAQFYLTDTRVLKVMFSAIATACAGLALLSGLGVLDLSLVTVPETFLGPHVVGGLLLGAGFMISAYCPGTGIVAMASGKWDGLWSIVGVMAGSFLFGLLYGPLQGFYESGAMGSVTLADALGIPFPLLAAGVVAMAIGAFLGAEKLETIFAPKTGKPLPAANVSLRNRQFAALGALAVFGLVAWVGVPKTRPVAAGKPFGRLDAVALAKQVVSDPQGLWIVDLREPGTVPPGERVPGTATLPEGTSTADFVATLPPTRTLVVYAQGDVPALPAGFEAFGGEVLALAGGFDAWKESVLAAPQPPADPTPARVAEFRMRSALSGYFTGASAPPPPKLVPRAVAAPAPRKGGGC